MPRPFVRTRMRCSLLNAGLVLACALMPASVYAQAGASLAIQPGARQNALGAAGVALFGDPSDGLWWNPAALGFANRMSVQYTHATLVPNLADIPYHHAALAVPLGSHGGFGVSYTRLDGSGLASPAFGPPSFWDESAPSIALGFRVLPSLSVGANVKWVDLTSSGFFGLEHGETFTADLGVLARWEREPWRFGFGAMYQNLDGAVEFGSTPPSVPLQRFIRLGASAAIPFRLNDEVRADLTAVLDYHKSDIEDGFDTWHGGIEASVTPSEVVRLALRGGYYDDHRGEIEDFTYGFGIRAAILSVDAAWIPQARDSGLPRVTKVTVGLHADLSSGTPKWTMD